jgi:hypothetical protein
LGLLERELILLRIIRNRRGFSSVAFGLIFIGVACVIVAGLFITYYWTGNGAVKTQTKQFSNFNKLDVSSGFEVTITQSNTFSVSVTTNEGVIDLIQVSQSGETLTIRPQPGAMFSASTLKAEIAMPVLNGVVFSGGTRGTASGFSSSQTFIADLTGGSSFESSDLTSGDVHVDLSGASSFNVQGTGGNLDAVISGASNLQMSSFQVNNAHLNLSGASHATVNPTGRLDVSASGFSSVTYYGNPTLGNIDASGGSTVAKG